MTSNVNVAAKTHELASIRARRNLVHRVGNAALNIAALGGLAAIALVALSLFFNISLIMFQTGSMSPTIPTGSVAMVREISASEIRVGDIVTVDRPGQLPVTHRVTSATQMAADGTRTIILKGDANEFEDRDPYTVSTVRAVLGSLPGVAPVIVWFSNPLVLGPIAVGAATLVTWAFWPRTSAGRRDAAAPIEIVIDK